jgi:hypothetical protein
MIRLSLSMCVAFGILTCGFAQDLRAQGHLGSVQQQRACRPDVLRHCRALMDESDYAISDCLRAHARALSPACREALQDAKR